MKYLSKIITNICIFLFCVGSVASAYILFKIPENFIAHVPSIHLHQLDLANPVFDMLYLTVGATLGIGILTITLLLVFRVNDKNQYASKSSQQKLSSKDVSEQEAMDVDILKIQGMDDFAHTRNGDTNEVFFTKVLSAICMQIEASPAAAYEVKQDEKGQYVEMFASYAHFIQEGKVPAYRFGEGIIGQVAKDGKTLNIKTVPEGYLSIVSGLGKATPKHLLVLPIKNEQTVVGVVEIASFKEFSQQQESAICQAFEKLSLKLTNNDNVSLEPAKL